MSKKKAEPVPETEIPDAAELPEGWRFASLDEVSELISGAGFPEKYQGQKSLKYPFFKVGNLGEVESGELLLNSEHSIDDNTVKELHAKIIPQNSIAFAKIGMAIRLNRRRMIGVPSCIDNNMMAAVPNQKIIPMFLLRYLETVEFMPLTQTTTVPSLRKSDLAQISVPLPPLPEQQRIVARIEALLAHVNEARGRLQRVPAVMKQFRQGVLAAACSGRLTEDLGDSKDWQNVNFRTVTINSRDGIKTGPFGSMLKKHEHTLQGVPVYGVENVRNLEFLPKNKIFITQEKADQLSNYDVKSGDILLTRSGTVGELCVVPRGIPNSRMSCNLMRIRVDLEKINPFFCCFSLYGSPIVLRQIADSCGGSTRNFIDGKILKTLEIPLPPLSEQHEIVRRVDALFARADAAEREVAAATKRAEALTQAVLAKAFSGKL
jgi:type I restriction enzyme S subunit